MASDITETIPTDAVNDIVEKYGLKMLELKPCRKVWQVKTDAGYKYLKKTKLDPPDLWFIYEALEFLYRNSFPQAPRLAWGKTGEPFVNMDTGLYVLTDWYFGAEFDFRTLMDLKQAARLMAEFHLKSAGFKPSLPNTDRTCWLNWPAKFENRLNQLQDFRRLANMEKETSTFSRLYLRNFEPYYRQSVASYLALLKSPYPEVAQEAFKKRSFCHHDYSGRNILRTYQNRLLLVDFDYCLLDIRIHDLINLLVRNLKHNNWNFDLGSFILKEYQQVSQLSPNEMEVLYVLLSWPQDFWQVGLQYYYEKLPWPKERFIKKLQHKIDYRLARDKFLQEFPKQYGIEESVSRG